MTRGQPNRTPEQREEDELKARAAEREHRMNSAVLRSELIEAFESIASDYGANGSDEGDLVHDVFSKLARSLK